MKAKPVAPRKPAPSAKSKPGALVSRNGTPGPNPVNGPSPHFAQGRPVVRYLDDLEAAGAAPSDTPATPPASTRTGGWTIQPSLPEQRVSDDLIQFLAQQRSK